MPRKNTIKRAFGMTFIASLALLSACGDVRVREFSAARWVEPGESIIYLEQYFTISGSGGSIGRPETTTYPQSRVRLYLMEAGADGLGARSLLFSSEDMVPCGELMYDPADSLVSFSYLPLKDENGRWRHVCPGNLERKLILGKLSGGSLLPYPETQVDSSLFLKELRDYRDTADSWIVIDSAYERLCVYQHCRRSSER